LGFSLHHWVSIAQCLRDRAVASSSSVRVVRRPVKLRPLNCLETLGSEHSVGGGVGEQCCRRTEFLSSSLLSYNTTHVGHQKWTQLIIYKTQHTVSVIPSTFRNVLHSKNWFYLFLSVTNLVKLHGIP
jgi:hypothetical protein